MYCKTFRNGRSELTEEPQVVRPRTLTLNNTCHVESLIHEDICKKKVKVAQLNVSPRSMHDTPGLRKVFAYGLMLTSPYSAKINQQGIPETKCHL
jgi:hypothetical protein